ncbi:MFS general substrate transporter [Dendrothele bispora CBS 962.96]|uniref:MFS general substrate transporter n=1 Tax=Dendrothele bispora (strain CBS 962.96) TaxID=1314807 RepID=A0A4S8MIA9_DENBC|nr:MFS general substrate transporter [Dendrothele bispora CBS 962.96]
MMLGWNDGSVGPLLPRIQEVYNVGFTIVSLLFVFNFIGYITGASINIWLNDKLGLGKTMVIGASFNIATYAIQSSAPPFPVLILSFCFAGFGSALQGAQGNGFVGSIKKNKATKLMLLHAAYGLGAFASPFLATHFAVQSHWSFHYLSSLAIAVINVILQLVVFRLKRQEELLREIGQFDDDSEKTTSAGASATSTIVAGADIEKAPTSDAVIEQGEGEEKKKSLYGQIFGIRVVHYLTAFALIYIGVECSVGSWIVTFIIRERNGGDSAGYISSGFFGGLMLGRLILIPVNKWVGEYIVVYIYMILSIAAQITIWVVPSIIENAIAASFIGFLLGPIFPIIVGQAVRVLPPTLFTGAVGWITGVGVAGSAVLPFITGLLATKYGIGSLQPFMVAMMCTMVCIWMLVPKRR